jgi:hypothetical protein
VAVALTLVAAATLGACGPDKLSKSDYISRANQLCASSAAQGKALTLPTTPSDIDTFVKKTHAILESLLEEFRKFEPPDSDRPTINRMLGDLQKASSYLPQLATAARDNDQQAIQDLVSKIQAVSNDASQIATDYGLTQCVNAGAGSVPNS